MDNGLIPHRYAKALYKYALEHDNTDEMYEIAKAVIQSFRDNPDLQKVLSNPFVKREEKERLLISAAGKGVDESYGRFVRLVLGHRRDEFFCSMMYAYRDIYRDEHHICQAHITTASELETTLMEKLRGLVTKAFAGSTVEFSESVNPDIIGGFVIDVESVRMDASVSNELEQLRQTLLRSN
ncbi:MAG: F0F1 ATP synthase subunit delta [Muribaculaceae bacterium]|nr:F0F1 ATP synthase subunit delta [Muribaculaceae bacterium]